jgi:putative hydrolase of the HAD superfamily
MSYDAVLFDLGSTLLNYDNSSWDELGRLGCKNACPVLTGIAPFDVTPERLWDDFHFAIDQMAVSHNKDFSEIDLFEVTNLILTKLGIINLDGLAGRFIDAYYQPITAQITLIPGAGEVLSLLRGAGLKIGLVSNTIFPAEFHRWEMKRFGIFDFFDFTLFSSEFKFRKPKPDIFLKALELADSKPERTIFVGDRLVEDVGGPQAVGIRGVLKRVEDRDYTAQVTPYKIITDLRELKDIILG